jgi:hypothetical protein
MGAWVRPRWRQPFPRQVEEDEAEDEAGVSGWTHSALTKAKITASRCKFVLSNSVKQLANSLMPMAQELVMKVFHPESSSVAVKRKRTFKTMVDAVGPMSIPINTKSVDRGDRDRVVVSHLEAQSNGLAQFSKQEGIKYTLSVNTYDDASMWISMPQDQAQQIVNPGDNSDAAKALLRRRRRGKMVRSPVLNLCEKIFLRVDGHGRRRVQASSPHSPAQVLPAANYSTVLDRWRNWSVSNGSATAGRNVDPLGAINPSPSESWGCIAMVKDGLMVNNNMACRIEQEIGRRKELAEPAASASVPGVFHMNCAAHSVVLCMKPIVHRIHNGGFFIHRSRRPPLPVIARVWANPRGHDWDR